MENILDLGSLSFYWRTSDNPKPYPGIPSHLPLRLGFDSTIQLIQHLPTPECIKALDDVYKLGFNIGYLQEEICL